MLISRNTYIYKSNIGTNKPIIDQNQNNKAMIYFGTFINFHYHSITYIVYVKSHLLYNYS